MKIKITCRPRYNPWLKKYLNTKTFSKMLALGVLINSVPINSFAGILSDDGRYETFEGSDITINNILEEDKVDVEIEGNTLVNLATKSSGTASEQNIIKLSYPTDKSIYIQLDCTSNNMESATQLGLIIRANYSDGTSDCVGFEKDGKSTGILYIQLKNPERKNIDSILIAPHIDVTSGDAEYEDLMILEGDWTNREIPDYFEGMKSVGQDDENGYKIEILSKNKNLLDLSMEYETNTNQNELSKRVTLTSNSITINEGNSVLSVVYKLKVKPNTNYILSCKLSCDGGRFNYPVRIGDVSNDYDLSKGSINTDGLQTISFTTSNEDVIAVKFYCSSTQSTFTASNVMLEEGPSSTSYVSHLLNKKEIALNEPLRSLPNGTKDKIIKRNGQWVVERNCGEVLFDGSDDEKWDINHYMDNCTGFYIKFNNVKGGITPLSSNLKKLNNYLVDEQGVFSTYNDDIFYININKSNLITENLDGLKHLLKNNPIKFIYQLKNPIYEPLNTDSTINLYEDTTHISTSSTIPANLKVTIDRTMNRATEAVELAKINPTTENLSLARMWTNLLRESIKKDELQAELNNNIDVADLQLERKTASSNVDVYIKSENMLSMNLSTNSITFDDFSGVEDMIKENAVNISINSSLPYNLNAYLATEIQNSDKSVAMNKDILSIKDNSELDYQTFSSINNKIVLKSNCNSGNDKQHDINLKLNSGIAHEKDVYKATIKFEAEQQ